MLKIFKKQSVLQASKQEITTRIPPSDVHGLLETGATVYEELTNEILPLFLPPKSFEWTRESVAEPKLTAGIQSFTESREGGEATIKARCVVLLFSVRLCSVSHVTAESCCITCDTAEAFKYTQPGEFREIQSHILMMH